MKLESGAMGWIRQLLHGLRYMLNFQQPHISVTLTLETGDTYYGCGGCGEGKEVYEAIKKKYKF